MVRLCNPLLASALLLLALLHNAHAKGGGSSGGGGGSSSGGSSSGGSSSGGSFSGGYPLTPRPGAKYVCPPGSNWTTCDINELRTIKSEIAASLSDPSWDDGSRAGAYIRGAWHNCGSYSASATGGAGDRVGGCAGGHMRFAPEKDDPANVGLEDRAPTTPWVASVHELLKPIADRHPCITKADLWTLAGVVSFISRSGGKMVPQWRPGRCDAPTGADAPPYNRLPDASFKSANGAGEAIHLREVFGRMGFTDKDIVLLSGIGHRMGRCHKARSNFDGAWDHNAVNFDTAYFKNLMGEQWCIATQIENTLTGQMVKGLNKQYVNNCGRGELLMLPTDLALRQDPAFAKWVNYYIKNQDSFYQDGAVVFATLMENGVDFQTQYQSMWV